jgi:hypothetical protein
MFLEEINDILLEGKTSFIGRTLRRGNLNTQLQDTAKFGTARKINRALNKTKTISKNINKKWNISDRAFNKVSTRKRQAGDVLERLEMTDRYSNPVGLKNAEDYDNAGRSYGKNEKIQGILDKRTGILQHKSSKYNNAIMKLNKINKKRGK